MILKIFFWIVILLSYTGLFSQNIKYVDSNFEKLDSTKANIISKKINKLKASNNFAEISLFEFEKSSKDKEIDNFVKQATILNLKREKLSSLFSRENNNITLRIPLNKSENFELELTKVNILSEDFKVEVRNGFKVDTINYNRNNNIFYQGMVKGNNNSIASVSISENDFIAVFSNNEGNYVIGQIKTDISGSKYILYNDADMLIENSFKCETVNVLNIKDENLPNSQHYFSDDDLTQLPIKICFECDYQIYLDKGSNIQNVVNYVTGLYNVVSTIYDNEGIPTQISRIVTWMAPDPYRNISIAENIHSLFRSNNTYKYNCNINHLLTTRNDNFNGVGGISYIDYGYDYFPGLLCNQALHFNWSNIHNDYNGFPNYSWSVNVIAHENGHLFGSPHTHSRCWAGGPFEVCACDTEDPCTGNCNPSQHTNATIMSYCHLNGSINFANGFGQLPGNVLRTNYSNANSNGCLRDLCLFGPLQIQVQVENYEALNSITAPCNSNNVTTSAATYINFRAGSQIVLNPGFTAEYASFFTAYIQPFDPNNNLNVLNLDSGFVSMEKVRSKEFPLEYSLLQNYPNPFNPVTLIKYSLKNNENVSITVFDILGRIVKVLVNEFQESGFKSVYWDGTNDKGLSVSSGVYIYKIITGNFTDSKKMLIIR